MGVANLVTGLLKLTVSQEWTDENKLIFCMPVQIRES